MKSDKADNKSKPGGFAGRIKKAFSNYLARLAKANQELSCKGG